MSIRLKFFKLNPFPIKTLINNIRKQTWGLKELIKEINGLKGELLQARVELEHLILTGSKDTEDHKIAQTKILEVRKIIKNKLALLAKDFDKEIKRFKIVDYKGQTISFRELKAIKQFEKISIGHLKYLEKKELTLAKSKQERLQISSKYIAATKELESVMIGLETKLNHTLKSLWEMANRQAIDGVEIMAKLSSQKQEKQQRVIKIGAKNIGDLVSKHKSKLKQLGHSKNLQEYMNCFKELVSIFTEEMEDILNMVKELRIFVFDLRGNFKQLKMYSKSIGNKETDAVQLEEHLKKALGDIESLYNWLYHEDRNYKKLNYDDWVQEIEVSQNHIKSKFKEELPKKVA